ncbi:MAG: rhomboid family intramembrane serine protease [Tabrizicola sp.]|jgi:membrane associated rhomboid family serine protease|uniref:rhomboid family intramembrane serine protease n=1 Tax=Tabrizicola sp. TaxID=2005166 RepID=UPI001B738F09|nr:rhomboid family intramembrane serine protease [Tabrizicola sp.]MCC6518235.1 rhomboid family intramembrane serine protease [Tabrizicola sp.]
MDPDHNAPPLNPLPWVVWLLALPLIAMEVVLSLGEAGVVGGPQAIGWRLQAVERFGLFPELLKFQWETGGHPIIELQRLVSYVLVHGSFTHALFAVVMVLALGNMVAGVFRWWGVLVVFLGSTVVGGAAYGLLVPGLRTQLIGAYPGIYGLIGAFTFLIWTKLALVGANRLRAFSLIGVLLAVQLVFGLLFGGGWDWVAEVTGFATGFLLSFVVSPGGFRRVVQMMRQR